MSTAIHDKAAVAAHEEASEEFRALTAGCGIHNLRSRAKIALRGGDRVRWLNGMVTNNIRDLAEGHGVYAFLLNPQGHILADLYTYNRGDSLLVDIDQAQAEKVLATFDHYIIMDDVEVADVTEELPALELIGPKAQEVLHKVEIEFPALEPLQFGNAKWQETAVTVVRNDNPCLPCFELWLAPEHTSSLLDAMVTAGASLVGDEALDLLRISCGIPRYGQDIRERDLPQETGQERALNFSKGCYIGQEIVERIRSRGAVHRNFTGFKVESALPPLGAKIQSDGKDVGEITSTAALPAAAGEMQVALGYLRREAALPGKVLQAGGAKLTVVKLPFAEVFPN